MGSSFKGLDLFGSGPHVFHVQKQGRRVVSLAALSGDPSVAGAIESGDRLLGVTVNGRLVSSSETGLWSKRDALTTQAGFGVVSGTLTDSHGRSWSDMYLLTVEWDETVDRGRTVSIGYRASFGALS